MKNRTTTIKLSRRGFVLGATAIPLAACSGPFGLSYKDISNAMATSVGLKTLPGITLERASQIPYASIGYRIDGGVEQLLVLATDTGTQRIWTSSARRVLKTEGGRVTASAGLPWNLSNTLFLAGEDPVAEGLQKNVPTTPIVRILDFQDIKRFGLPVQSIFESRGVSTIEILGTKLKTLAMREHCTCAEIDWTFTNEYWIDAQNGFVWRSNQTIHPNMGMLTINVLRPPR